MSLTQWMICPRKGYAISYTVLKDEGKWTLNCFFPEEPQPSKEDIEKPLLITAIHWNVFKCHIVSKYVKKSVHPLFMHEYKYGHFSAQGYFSLWQRLKVIILTTSVKHR